MFAISFHRVHGSEVCVVRVGASSIPVYFEDGADSRLYVHLGNTSRELTAAIWRNDFGHELRVHTEKN